ncbi:DNA-directed RNA polymerase subunit beta [Paenibacillus pinisoli]|uniref:DNA-directed RNA polymerase subunit beta n=2 Tax=Paenibacillus pinisoli TaxID=1276110 RepID=A0A3A6PKP4_9BACL|nr:DNA-directed RNA polymerase subunit beta [Paenibacillus pinisoli]
MKVIGMADDRIPASRRDFENGSMRKEGDEGRTLRYGSMSSTLSRTQRHGGTPPGYSGEAADPIKEKSRKPAQEELDEEDEERHRFPKWARIVFWMLRKSIVPVVMIVMLLVGLYVGFVYLGHGSKNDVFEWTTWRHLYDLIFAES